MKQTRNEMESEQMNELLALFLSLALKGSSPTPASVVISPKTVSGADQREAFLSAVLCVLRSWSMVERKLVPSLERNV